MLPIKGDEDIAEVNAANHQANNWVKDVLHEAGDNGTEGQSEMMPIARSTTLPRMMKARNSATQPGARGTEIGDCMCVPLIGFALVME